MPMTRPSSTSLETTYALQMLSPAGDWYFTSQAEYETEQDIHDLAAHMYGGIKAGHYRPVRIDRTPI